MHLHRVVASVVLLAALHAAAATPDAAPVEYLGPTDGTFLLGLFGPAAPPTNETVAAPDLGPSGVNHARWDLAVDDCHTRLFADLDYAPAHLLGREAPVDLLYTFRLRIETENASVDRHVTAPQTVIPLGELWSNQTFTLRLVLYSGAAVDWSLRVYGHETLLRTPCAPEAEPA